MRYLPAHKPKQHNLLATIYPLTEIRHQSTMRQALISQWGEKPKLVRPSETPGPKPDEMRIKVEAVGIHRLVRARASGEHYSSGSLPQIPGVDGVGTTEDGQGRYFISYNSGTLADYVNVPKLMTFSLPNGMNDYVQIAATVNPAISSWMALKMRSKDLPQDFTCLIIGATSASGRVAIPLARALGAKQVIGAARNQTTLDSLGLDRTIILTDTPQQTDFSNLDDVDVILDYVYGPITIHLLGSLRAPKPVQYIHIGSLAAKEMSLSGEVLRSKDITIRGAGAGSWSRRALVETMPALLATLPTIPEQAVRTVRLEDIETEWDYAGLERLVFVP